MGEQFVSDAARDRHASFLTTKYHAERFIDYSALHSFNVLFLLRVVGLSTAWPIDNRLPYYPNMVKEFYANMSSYSTADGITITTRVKKQPITITANGLSCLLGVPPTNTLSLANLTMDDPFIRAKIANNYTHGESAVNFTSTARLILKIIMYNLIPKAGSFNYLGLIHAKCLYAIMGGLPIHWGLVILNSLLHPVSNYFFHPSLITLILHVCHIDLSGENSITNQTIFDESVITNMRLIVPEDDEEEDDDDDDDDDDEDNPDSPNPIPQPTPNYTPSSAYTQSSSRSPFVSGHYSGRMFCIHKHSSHCRTNPTSCPEGSQPPSRSREPTSSLVRSLRQDIQHLHQTVNDGFARTNSALERQAGMLNELQTSHGQLLSHLETLNIVPPSGTPTRRTRPRTSSPRYGSHPTGR